MWAGEGAGCPEHPQPGLPCLPRVPREGSSPACASAAVEVETASQASDEEDAPATDIYFVSPPGIPPVAGPSTTCAHTCTHTHVPVRTHVCLHPHPFTHAHTAPSQARADTSHTQGACAHLHVHSHSGTCVCSPFNTQGHVPGQHAHTQVLGSTPVPHHPAQALRPRPHDHIRSRAKALSSAVPQETSGVLKCSAPLA